MLATKIGLAGKEVDECCEEVEGRGGEMTSADLIQELSGVHDAFEWMITGGGRIRARLKTDEIERAFDPITAVAYLRTGEYTAEGRVIDAAQAIGLTLPDCADVLASCNYEWDSSTRQGELRQEVLRVLALESEKDAPSAGFSFAKFQPFAKVQRKRIASATH